MTGQLLAFLAASLVVIVVPGPDMMLMLRNTGRAGRSGALWTAAGILTGLAIVASAAALGVSAVLVANPAAFGLVELAGGIYLLYLGSQAGRAFVRLRRERHRDTASSATVLGNRSDEPGARVRAFRQGLLSNLLNPKTAAFFLALFPQFDLGALAPVLQSSLLAGAFWLLCLLWYIGLIAGLTRAATALQTPAFARRTEAAAGLALCSLGLIVLVGVPA